MSVDEIESDAPSKLGPSFQDPSHGSEIAKVKEPDMDTPYVAAVKESDGKEVASLIVYKLDEGFAVYKFFDDGKWIAQFCDDNNHSDAAPFTPTAQQVRQGVTRIKHAAGKMARLNTTPKSSESEDADKPVTLDNSEEEVKVHD